MASRDERIVLGIDRFERGEVEEVNNQNPFPVTVIGSQMGNVPFSADVSWRLSLEGRMFYASDADQNDYVTGQTSFANTTPTFILQNPAASGVLCVPLFYCLTQAGSVAGGDINIDTEIRNSDAYASSGTDEKVANARPKHGRKAQCHLWSGATATAGYGIAIAHATLAADISPAEGIINEYLWTPVSGIDILDPGTCLQVFTYAAVTGPTFGWVFKWAEIDPANFALS